MVKVETCGVPTPKMGPWKSEDVITNRPRYAVVDGLSVPDKELIGMHVDQRLSAEEIARRIKEDPVFVRRRLRRLKVYDKTRRPLRLELDEERMVLLYKHGYSPREIGEHLGGVDKGTILARLRKMGRVLIPSRTPVGYTKAKVKYAEMQGRDRRVLLKKFAPKRWRRRGRRR